MGVDRRSFPLGDSNPLFCIVRSDKPQVEFAGHVIVSGSRMRFHNQLTTNNNLIVAGLQSLAAR